MKTAELILLAGIALLSGVTSCSRGISADVDHIHEGSLVTGYMSVYIVSDTEAEGGRISRAENGEHVTGDGTYVTGTENTIHSVRFYFFKANGNAAYVKHASDNTFVNYMDWPTPGTSDPAAPGDDVSNVEKIVNAQLVINTEQGDELPMQIIAIVNPPQNMPDVADIASLNTITGNYSVTTAAGPFIMSNSVYVDAEGNEAEGGAVSIKGHVMNTVQSAQQNPVTIFVERVNAKVIVDCGLTPAENMDNTYDTGVKVNNAADKGLAEGKIYVRFLGWDVTQATGKSYLVKHIDKTWTDADVFGSSSIKWNIPDRYRSFWAINPNLVAPKETDSDYMFKNFDQHQTAVGAVGDFTPADNYLYLQENAAADASNGCSYPTQLIIAAQLVNEQGGALTLAEYGFFQYTIEGLKTEMADKANIYKKDPSVTEGTRFVKINSSDIVLLSAAEAGQASPTQEGRYYIYAAIKGTDNEGAGFNSEETTAYYTSNADDAQPATYKAVNARLLEDCGHAKLWDRGYTYYYADIQHLGGKNSNGWKGIVRNHIYTLNINSLSGLGTPVYRPEEVIYPEKPNSDETYIGAEVKVLPWRLVNQDVSFAW